MKPKKKLLKKSRLYIIIDKKVSGNKAIFANCKIAGLGIDIIQLRDKISDKETILRDAQTLRKLLLKTKTIFIINDYLDIAKMADSDGIHLGQGDLPIEIARRLLGKDKIIGISCHNLKQALNAQNAGADYISVGPIFPTSTKPEYKPVGLDLIRGVRKKIKIPFFVIGGINKNNLNKILSYQAKRVAICSAVYQTKNILNSIRNFRKRLDN